MSEYTERGFRVYATVTDSKQSEVRVQESSAAFEGCVWIFCKNADPSYRNPAPHLTVDQARVVRDALDAFIAESGDQPETVTISGQRYQVVEWDRRGDQGHGFEEFVLYATPIEEATA